MMQIKAPEPIGSGQRLGQVKTMPGMDMAHVH
jgi:hypothetical protein